ncbi:hypothetical protein Taro_012594 [Colocasia esculenta]|uniref:Uncharacterized protein n=1 Tax=Colocasia esculenta TaxID=4460 RepID=A0A843U971_COLES|nr:hypothetical protein [Colocasia esculenta]
MEVTYFSSLEPSFGLGRPSLFAELEKGSITQLHLELEKGSITQLHLGVLLQSEVKKPCRQPDP